MRMPSRGTASGGVGRLVACGVIFVLLAPAGLVALPVAALLAVSRPGGRAERVTLAVAAAVAAAWLLTPGDLADQTLRAAAVFAAAVFLVLTLRTGASVTHRALAALAGAVIGVVALSASLGSSWGALRWTVAQRTGLAARTMIGWLWSSTAGPATPGDLRVVADLEAWLAATVQLMAEFFPAIAALELLAGLALAVAIYHRVARAPLGRPPGRFRDFRFSEHLGWAAVLPLLVLLVPKLAAAKAAAGNLLAVIAVVYALRGAAVAASGVAAAGLGGPALVIGTALLFVFLLPVVAAGSILLGVVDAGLDLRRRWATPSVGE